MCSAPFSHHYSFNGDSVLRFAGNTGVLRVIYHLCSYDGRTPLAVAALQTLALVWCEGPSHVCVVNNSLSTHSDPRGT